jgi:hypothetical protein
MPQNLWFWNVVALLVMLQCTQHTILGRVDTGGLQIRASEQCSTIALHYVPTFGARHRSGAMIREVYCHSFREGWVKLPAVKCRGIVQGRVLLRNR